MNSTNNEINKRKRTTKKEKYRNERNEIIRKFNEILGISEERNYMYSYDIENVENIKEEINKLSTDIQKYFKCGSWNYFVMKNKNLNPLEISLIRAVYRDENITMVSKDVKIERNGEKIKTIMYYLVKKNSNSNV